jgi:tetrameric-type glycyl-tRNA synthetase beta subunit
MADKQDLLVEIGTEELPPQALPSLAQAFEDGFVEALKTNGLAFEKLEQFATPRRIALRLSGLDSRQQDQEIQRKGPALKAAYDAEGQPSKAALGFARSCGVDISELQTEEGPKGAWLVFKKIQPGQPSEALIPAMVQSALAKLPIPKRMRWGSLSSEFVRPVHWIVLLLGERVVEAEIMDVQSGRTTRGHRFHHPEPIELATPADYDALLRDTAWVEPQFAARREKIRTAAEAAARAVDATAVIDDKLLDEVTSLNEWPVAVMGDFDPEFLEVPSEALIETMQKNQKYFPVVDAEGKLLPRFITISNIESRDPAQVKAGNERVIRPRFKDAVFFWEQDLKTPLAEMSGALASVVFQNKLGTLLDKAQRIGEVGSIIAQEIGLEPALAQRAALLCKCDLLTNMVGEFASLQGVMGRYYAEAAGEDAGVCQAMEEHYLPKHAGDRLPQSLCGQALALADKLDSLVGIFAIGQRPSGVKDPYGLRRAALGVLRIMIEQKLDLDLRQLLEASAQSFADKVDAAGVVDEVFDYIMDRLKGYYADQGVAGDVLDAVLARRPTHPLDIDTRVQAVSAFKKLPEAASLAAANKRIRNILKKASEQIPAAVADDLLREDSERQLNARMTELGARVAPLFAAGQYEQALSQLASLRPEVDTFFDQVMVMCEESEVRKNRLAILRNIESSFLNVADISRLQ